MCILAPVPSKPQPVVLEVAGHEVSVSNPDKVYFPEAGITKIEVVRYYLSVAEGALRHAGGRPNVLVRYANGIGGEFFYQKRAPEKRPDFVDVVALSFPSGRTAEEVVPRHAATLAWMANLGCLELHPHPVRADDLDHPDELRIDLDPVPGVEWPQIVAVARVVRDVLPDLDLVGWPKTSGSRGIHINVRLHRRWGFDEVRRAALAIAREVERRAPDIATSKWWKEERHGVFLDYNQNAKDRTVCSAYSIRPKPDARVSAPLTWEELDTRRPEEFTLRTMPARFAEIGDRHADMDAHPCSLDKVLALSAEQEAGRPGRRAVAAALPEAGRRAAAGAAVQGAQEPDRPARLHQAAARDRAREVEGGRARRARALEGEAPGGGGAAAAAGRAGRLDARPLVVLVARAREPGARPGSGAARAGAARVRLRPVGRPAVDRGADRRLEGAWSRANPPLNGRA